MKRPWSIALRLALLLTLVTGIFWIGAAAVSTAVLQHELQEAFDDSLSQSAYRLLPLALHDLREPNERHGPVQGLDDSDQSAFTYFVHDGAGKVLIRAEDAPDDITTLPTAEGYVEVDGRRAFSISDPRSGLGIVVLEMSNHRQEALVDAAGTLFWPLVALIPLLGIGIWISVRFGMRPLNRFSNDIALRGSGNLSPLDAAGQPAELAPIAGEVTALLDRLKAAMDSERSFAANSAHELRTPIAGALAQTQRLALDLGNHPAKGRVQEVERALRHLSLLSEKLLQLARLEAGFARSDEPVALQPITELVIRDFQTAHATAGRVQLEIDPDIALFARINPDAFAIALRNLVQNGLIHGPADGEVDVLVHAGPVVVVRNHGPIVRPEILAQLGTRFARGDTGAKGTGLGLAIVEAIVQQAGGTMRLASPIPGQADGFEVTLDLSRAGQAGAQGGTATSAERS
ncbi:MAG: two-component sensor histidine kinase [Alphaproteobacteria bacterium]|nr:two-component sensor histidine kinase [Alphaproteobacteria bacterium]